MEMEYVGRAGSHFFLALFPAFLRLVDCLNAGIVLCGEAWDIIGTKKKV